MASLGDLTRSQGRHLFWIPPPGMVTMSRIGFYILSTIAAFAVATIVVAQVTSRPAVLAAGSLTGWERIQTPTAKYTTSGQKDALCSSGKKVLSGGYHIVGANQALGFAGGGKFYVAIDRSLPDGEGWRVAWYAWNTESFWVNVYAICADVR